LLTAAASRKASPSEACKLSLRSTARRWLNLNAEIIDLTTAIGSITATAAPQLLDLFGVGPDVAAALLITVGGNPETDANRTQLRRPLRRVSHSGIIG
jgi:hypothetical protein